MAYHQGWQLLWVEVQAAIELIHLSRCTIDRIWFSNQQQDNMDTKGTFQSQVPRIIIIDSRRQKDRESWE